MTAPNNPNEQAKTAEEVSEALLVQVGHRNNHIEHQWCIDYVRKVLESYADSVAEERVKECIVHESNATYRLSTPMAYTEGFRAGQERMRERAASLCDDHLKDHDDVCTVNDEIRSLGVELPTVEEEK